MPCEKHGIVMRYECPDCLEALPCEPREAMARRMYEMAFENNCTDLEPITVDFEFERWQRGLE